jgi:ectoine hydroxylase-related dioxygenase (phytanoyl-CoA dioxygenase family)
MRNPLAESDIEAFHRDGAIAVRNVVDDAWLALIAEGIEADIADPGPFYHGYAPENGVGRFHGNLRTWETQPALARVCLESELPDLAREIMGSSKVNLLYDQLFVKEPGTTNRTRWHNDQPYWPVDGYQILTIWVALDETTRESGALEFVRGSHKWQRLFQPEVFGKANTAPYETNPDYEPMIDIEMQRADHDIITFDLAPGDVYVFHALTVHGAGGNFSPDRRRRGYAVRYMGDDATYSTRLGVNAGLRNASKCDGDAMDCAQYPPILR